MKKIYSKPVMLNESLMLESIIALSKTDDPATPGGGLIKERDEFPNAEDKAIIQLQADQEEGTSYDLW